MNYYFDVVLKPDDEMRINVLLNKVYTKFHKGLCTLQSTNIGVSFPRYDIMLGNLVRIHGEKARLSELQTIDWLGALGGYCRVSSIQAIPTEVTYRNIARTQSNMTEAKLRRLIRRNSISPEEIKGYKAKMFHQGIDNPYLELESSSTGHKHRRYIQFGELGSQSIDGEFDQFGLSKTATVPWF